MSDRSEKAIGPPILTCVVEFTSERFGDSLKHRLVAEEVRDELALLAPLMVRERLLMMELEDVRQKMKDFRK